MESSIIKRERVQLGRSGAAALPARTAPGACSARAQAVVVAGVVHAIEVACACGEVMLVELDYPETATEKQR
jgi:hypothetical protein